MKHCQSNRKERDNQVLYVGIDVGKKVWSVTILTDEMEIKTIASAPSPKKLSDYLKREFSGYEIYSVYEAGYCGFWIHKELLRYGIKNIIVNPADVPKSNKERKTKTDRVDSRTLAYSLRAKSIQGIYVPEDGMITDRNLVRLRETEVRDETRTKNRIKSLLNYLGLEVRDAGKSWSKGYIEKLSKLEIPGKGDKYKLEVFIEELAQKRATVLKVTKEIRELSKSEKYKEDAKNLISVPGIGILSAMVIITEISEIDRFSRFDSLNNYSGFLPTEHSSGGKEKKGHMMPRGNKKLKDIMIEAAWVAVRTDTALKNKFEELKKRMKASKAIIIISRKLLSSIYHIMKTKETYKSMAA
jgi:transposase